jgi:hypothetical protein
MRVMLEEKRRHNNKQKNEIAREKKRGAMRSEWDGEDVALRGKRGYYALRVGRGYLRAKRAAPSIADAVRVSGGAALLRAGKTMRSEWARVRRSIGGKTGESTLRVNKGETKLRRKNGEPRAQSGQG